MIWLNAEVIIQPKTQATGLPGPSDLMKIGLNYLL